MIAYGYVKEMARRVGGMVEKAAAWPRAGHNCCDAPLSALAEDFQICYFRKYERSLTCGYKLISIGDSVRTPTATSIKSNDLDFFLKRKPRHSFSIFGTVGRRSVAGGVNIRRKRFPPDGER